MRNFKKFLALVLAMLMVSACAVSVSAAYTDQEAINASKYAEAVEVMSALGVFEGNEKNEFGLDKTLRRDEAAKIAAVTLKGAESKNVDWTSATCLYSDVTGAWSYAYINYASQRNIMKGVDTENNVFNAEGTLNLDQALTIAVRLADPEAAARAEKNQKDAPAAYWAAYWINEAEALDLDEDLGVIDYTQPCTRGMMAQILYNIVKANDFDNDVATRFGLIKHPVMINYATEEVVNVTKLDENLNEVLEAYTEEIEIPVEDGEEGETEKVEVTRYRPVTLSLGHEACLAKASEVSDFNKLGGYIATVTYSKTGDLYGISIDSTAKTFTFAEEKIANTKYNDNKNFDKYITIDGVKYVVAASAEVSGSGVIGGAVSKVPAIEVTEIGANARDAKCAPKTWYAKASGDKLDAIPAYYVAVAYNDDADAEFERLVINRYEVATIDYDSNIKDNKVTDGVVVDHVKFVNDVCDTFNNYDGLLNDKKEKAIVYTGVVNEGKSETLPMLVNITLNQGTDTWDVNILEAAKTVSGTATNIKPGEYITLGTDPAIAYSDTFVEPNKWVLGQNVTLYTINGEYVNVVNPGVEVGMQTQKVLVDNVTVADGVALIDGYIWNSNGTFTAVTDMKVVGYVDASGRLLTKAPVEIKNAANTADKTYAGLIGIGTLNDAGNAWKSINDEIVTFNDGYVYTFDVTAAGAYAHSKNATPAVAIDNYAGESNSGVELKNGYVYVGGAAQYKLASNYTVLTKANADSSKEDYNNAYNKISFATVSSFKADTATIDYWGFNADGIMVDVASAQTDVTVAFVYVTASANKNACVLQKTLNEGETIVQLVSVENEGLTESVFNAINIFTGEKVTVTGNDAAGNYAVVKDGKIVDDNTMWVEKNLTLDVAVNVDGKVYSGYNRMIHSNHKGEGSKMDNDMYKDDKCGHYDDENNYIDTPTFTKKDAVKYGIDKITYWKLENNAIKETGDLNALITSGINTTGELSFTGCIINGQVIIIGTPTYTVDAPAEIN